MTDDAFRARLAGIVAGLFPGAKITSIARHAGGVSANVHRLDLTLADGRTTSVVLRSHRPAHSSHSAELEFRLLQALHGSRVPVPEPLLVDVSGEVLADPFLIMEFVDGNTAIPAGQENQFIERMADVLSSIHALPTAALPKLPTRNDPLPEILDYLPDGPEWAELGTHLRSLTDTAYVGPPKLLHGDFWPENLLWRNDAIAAVLDWEDAAHGDPLSDVACCLLELRYKFGESSKQRFTQAYARHQAVDLERLTLWQVYVAAAAQRFMGQWGLAPRLEAHMRREALASIREAGAALMSPAV